MGSYKVHGPDGYGASFYQHHWLTFGFEVTIAVLSFLNGSTSIEKISYTYLTLMLRKQ